MADKTTQMMLDALSRAVHDPDGVLLHPSKTGDGLFPATTAGRQIAQRCKDEGYLRVLSSESKGRGALEYCSITEKGLQFLLREADPKHVLEDFVRVLEVRQVQMDELVGTARRMQAGMESLQAAAQSVLRQLEHGPASLPGHELASANGNGAPTWTVNMVRQLADWQARNSGEDCPLPELYHHVRIHSPHLTIGQFHDGLRQLHDEQKLYLHPWTGPLYALPEPPFALLIGHEIAYYASLRH